MKICEYAGRKCYDSVSRITDTSYEQFLKNVIRRGHTSVLEHGKISLEVVTSRDVLAEITRHRAGIVFSVQSQRYVKADKAGGIEFIRPEFYIPPEGDKTDVKKWCASRAWELSMQAAEKDYAELSNQYGCANEDSRKVLPNSTATSFVVTMNFREFLHIFELRSSPRAYPEMRVMIAKMIEALTPVLPPIWEWAKEIQEGSF